MTNFGLDTHILDKIKAVLALYQDVDSAGIFGSRARGDYKNYSDIDIVVHAPTMTTVRLMDLCADLHKLPIIFKMDVVHFDGLDKPELASTIQRDEIEIYSAKGKR